MGRLLKLLRNRTFLPTDLPNLALWLDASDLSTITRDGSDKVSQWSDKSGRGNHATQGTGANQPTWTATGFSGKPSILFGAHELAANDSASLDWSALSVFVICQAKSGTGVDNLVWKSSTDGTREFTAASIRSNASPVNIWAITFPAGTTASQVIHQSGYTYSLLEPLVIDYLHSGTAGTITVNGTSSSAGSAGVYNSTDKLRIGHAATADESYISEVALYTAALTTAQRQQVIDYLKRKWGM